MHRCALSSHLIELRRVGAACLRRHVHPHKGHRRSGIGIGSSCLHCLCLCADQGRSCKGSISKRCRFLHLLDRLFIFRIGGDAGNTERNNFDASLLSPLLAKNLVQSVCQLHGMRRHFRITDAHGSDFGESRLQSSEQFRFQLGIQLLPSVLVFHITTDIRIKQHRITNMVAVFSERTQTNIHINSRPLIQDTEGNRRCRTVFIADNLLGIEIIDPLVFRILSAEGKTLGETFKGSLHPLLEIAAEDRRLRRSVIGKGARFCTEFDNLSLIYNHHALPVSDRYNGSGRDDIVISFVGASPALHACASCHQHFIRQGVAGKIFFKLICKNA